jgi:hypothetical protein
MSLDFSKVSPRLKHIIALEVEFQPEALEQQSKSLWAIHASYLLALRNPSITGSHWNYVFSLAAEALLEAQYCDHIRASL